MIAYAGIPLSTLSSASGLFNTWNVQTSFYLVTVFGLIATLRGAKFSSSLIALSYFLMAWYVVLLSIELFHGGPFHFRFPRGANFLTDYFPLVALPFFVIGLKETKADLRIFEYVMMGTVVFSAGLSLYQFFVVGDDRPRGFSLNPIPFALIVLVWSLFVFSRALQTEKIDWPRLTVALVGLVPIVLSGSKLVWLGAALGYSALFVMWARTSGRWGILAAAAVVLAPIVWALWQVEVLRGRITEFSGDLGAFLASGSTSGPTFGLRYAAAVSGLHAFLDRPLLGYGMAGGRIAALEHRPPGISSFAQLPHLHSDYVTHLVAFGVLGLIFLVSLFAAFILASVRRDDIALCRFGIVAGSLFLIYMTVEVIFTQPELSGLVFFLFGLILLAPERLSATQTPATRPWRPFSNLVAPVWSAMTQPPTSVAGVNSHASRQDEYRWRVPARPIRILLVALLVGLVGFSWSQSGAFFRISQTALLYEHPDDPARPGGSVNKVDGSVVWRFAGEGPNGSELIANFDIPATGAKFRLTMRRNADAALAASYIVEVGTSTPRDFPDKAVTEIGKLIVKLAPEAEGAELIGDVAQISEGVFWMGLSADPTDADVNLRLLALGNFFDLPLTYKSGEHATLTFEKGRTGVAAFEQAITAFRR